MLASIGCFIAWKFFEGSKLRVAFAALFSSVGVKICWFELGFEGLLELLLNIGAVES